MKWTPPFILAGLAVLVVGCGRQANESDCQLIVDRSVEIQMKELKITDPEQIEHRKVQLRSELQGEMKQCIGRRVTDKMMACVRGANTSEELDRCMR
jgi:hypothetical protein